MPLGKKLICWFSFLLPSLSVQPLKFFLQVMFRHNNLLNFESWWKLCLDLLLLLMCKRNENLSKRLYSLKCFRFCQRFEVCWRVSGGNFVHTCEMIFFVLLFLVFFNVIRDFPPLLKIFFFWYLFFFVNAIRDFPPLLKCCCHGDVP